MHWKESKRPYKMLKMSVKRNVRHICFHQSLIALNQPVGFQINVVLEPQPCEFRWQQNSLLHLQSFPWPLQWSLVYCFPSNLGSLKHFIIPYKDISIIIFYQISISIIFCLIVKVTSIWFWWLSDQPTLYVIIRLLCDDPLILTTFNRITRFNVYQRRSSEDMLTTTLSSQTRSIINFCENQGSIYIHKRIKISLPRLFVKFLTLFTT